MTDYTTPDRDSAALLTIDVQRDFTLPDAPATIPSTMDAVPRIRRVVEAFRQADRPVLHVVRLYREDGSNVDLCRRGDVEEGLRFAVPGSGGAEVVDELTPEGTELNADRLLDGELQEVGEREWFMYKPRWSAFFGTPLDTHLREIGVDSVVVCGCNYPNCPRTTVYDASQRDYRVAFVRDATSRTYERGMEELSAIGVELMTAEEAASWVG